MSLENVCTSAVHIERQVFEKIVSRTILMTPEVANWKNGTANSIASRILPAGVLNESVSVDIPEDASLPLIVRVSVAILEGNKIPDVANGIIESIKKEVLNSTGKTVAEVHVNVFDIVSKKGLDNELEC